LYRTPAIDSGAHRSTIFSTITSNDEGLLRGTLDGFRTTSKTHVLVEPNYVLVLNEGENTQYFPVRIGVAFGLQVQADRSGRSTDPCTGR